MANTSGLDDGIERLERFNALLARTTTGLEQDRGRLDTRGQALERLRGAGEDRLHELQQELASADREAESGHAQAEQAVTALSDQAAGLAEAELGEALERMESVGGHVERALSTAREDLEQGSAELRSEGFTPALAGLEAFEAERARLSELAEQSFGDVAAALSEARAQVEEAEGEAEQAAADLGAEAGQTSGLEPVGGLAAYVGGTFVPELQAELATLQSGLQDEYTSLGAEVETEQDGLLEEVSAAIAGAALQVEQDGLGALADAVEEMLEGPVQTLAAELAEAETALDAGAEVAESASRQAPQLEWAKRVVAEIQRLLDAMSVA
jgi:hypothetical protein